MCTRECRHARAIVLVQSLAIGPRFPSYLSQSLVCFATVTIQVGNLLDPRGPPLLSWSDRYELLCLALCGSWGPQCQVIILDQQELSSLSHLPSPG